MAVSSMDLDILSAIREILEPIQGVQLGFAVAVNWAPAHINSDIEFNMNVRVC